MDFETVVDRHYEDLYRFAFSLAKNRDEACDLVQQAYLVFAEKGAQVRDPGKVKNWLFTTLYREFLRLRERGRRHVSLEDESARIPEPEAPGETGRSAERAELLECLAGLDDGHREVLALFYLRQHSYRDIAAILGIPIGTVMSRLSRAKTALRRKIGAGAGGDGFHQTPSGEGGERGSRDG